ncbi:MAG TPA: amidase [Acidimicrobiia bacterium]|nr:amidase [Acidimicrobiia bacterium]
MPVQPPTVDQLRDIAESFGLTLTEEDLSSYRGLIAPLLAAYAEVERMVEPTPLAPQYARTAGHRPEPSDNPCNAWYWRCDIRGAAGGPLAGKRVAVKDNVCVAGVPMMNGSATLEGYVPDVDATIVTRTLDAGGVIVGKSVCEDLCFSAGSHTAATGPVLNPWDPTRSAGGSSSGSAALVALGEVDLAIGGDQGGSIRVPAAWTGIVGHKPTYGLVPYTGVFPMELTLDHTGPMAATVADVARYLEVLAGADGLDPRQPSVVASEPYGAGLDGDLSGVRIGVVAEGFGWEGRSEAAVDEAVQEAARRLEKAGAAVGPVSVPMHRQGLPVWMAIAMEGATELMVKGNATGTNWKGHYITSLLDAYGRGRRARVNDLADTVKLVMLFGEYLRRTDGGRHYARGQNLAPRLRAAYDAALAEVDVLVMPTVPMLPTAIPPPGAPREEYVARAFEMVQNTAPFNVTGHPAISVPCHPAGSLPIGMMIVGRHFADASVLRVAAAAEERCDAG